MLNLSKHLCFQYYLIIKRSLERRRKILSIEEGKFLVGYGDITPRQTQRDTLFIVPNISMSS